MWDKPTLAFTLGDPAGIGPEILIKALSNPHIRDICRPVVMGDVNFLIKVAEDMAIIDCNRNVEALSSIDRLHESMAEIPVLQSCHIDLNTFQYGAVRSEHGKAAGESIEKAVALAISGQVDGVVTPPIQKEAFHLAGYPYPGHTEFLADLTHSRDIALMLMKNHFRVVHLSLHKSLIEAVKDVTQDNVLKMIRIAAKGCEALGIERPRIGVAGLNPHAGENGLFGREEIDFIIPAIETAKRTGINVSGPLSSDSIFAMLQGGAFDIVVCMYHDQGGIPMKLLSFEWNERNKEWASIRGVNVTLGLPVIRTSVSHGTGYEIAGRGIASPDSLVDAIETAVAMVHHKRKRESHVQTA